MKRIIREMEKTLSDVQREVKATIKELVALCENFRGMGKAFTFASSGTDAQVNALLLELSNRIQEDFDDRIQFAIEESEDDDNDGILAYVGREYNGMTSQERIDGHVSRLKYLVEGFIAIGFSSGFSATKIRTQLYILTSNPDAMGYFADARKAGGFKASYITDGDLNSRKGWQRDIIKSISGVGATMIADAFHYGCIDRYKRSGAIGYGVQRNSTYDCPDCDDVCAVIHPFSEIVVPVHPNCCCSTFPVYAEDL